MKNHNKSSKAITLIIAVVIAVGMLAGCANQRINSGDTKTTDAKNETTSVAPSVGQGAAQKQKEDLKDTEKMPETAPTETAPPDPIEEDAPTFIADGIACEIFSVGVGNRTFNPVGESVLFVLNNVLQGSGQIIAATEANLFISFSFVSDTGISSDTTLVLSGTGGEAVKWSQNLSFSPAENTLQAYINMGGPAEDSYLVELYFDGVLAFSEEMSIIR